MKLLFDEQLSPSLVHQLDDLYPGSSHVHLLGHGGSSDTAIWALAAEQDWTVVTKDADFQERSLLLGAPPRVIWLRIGNCSTRTVAELLRIHSDSIRHFHEQPDSALLTLPVHLLP